MIDSKLERVPFSMSSFGKPNTVDSALLGSTSEQSNR